MVRNDRRFQRCLAGEVAFCSVPKKSTQTRNGNAWCRYKISLVAELIKEGVLLYHVVKSDVIQDDYQCDLWVWKLTRNTQGNNWCVFARQFTDSKTSKSITDDPDYKTACSLRYHDKTIRIRTIFAWDVRWLSWRFETGGPARQWLRDGSWHFVLFLIEWFKTSSVSKRRLIKLKTPGCLWIKSDHHWHLFASGRNSSAHEMIILL